MRNARGTCLQAMVVGVFSTMVWRAQSGRSDWKSGRSRADFSAWTQLVGNLGNGDYMGILMFK